MRDRGLRDSCGSSADSLCEWTAEPHTQRHKDTTEVTVYILFEIGNFNYTNTWIKQHLKFWPRPFRQRHTHSKYSQFTKFNRKTYLITPSHTCQLVNKRMWIRHIKVSYRLGFYRVKTTANIQFWTRDKHEGLWKQVSHGICQREAFSLQTSTLSDNCII